ALPGAGRPARSVHPAAAARAAAGGRPVPGGEGMKARGFVVFRPGQPLPREQVPHRPVPDFRRAVVAGVGSGYRVSALFGDAAPSGPVDLYAVLADPHRGLLGAMKTTLDGDRYPSLTPE